MSGWEREWFAASPVARLATVTPAGRPHVVPVVFAVQNDVVWMAVDGKPKRSRALQRLHNIAANPQVSLIVDHYDDDWTSLWWVRADGGARVVEQGSADEEAGLRLLVDRYPQYADQPPAGPVVAVGVDRWHGWRARDWLD
ncbi:TIGR03668 family PPOX class F420-dependent oxidoreductase [Pedococcus sp. 5OH_020]|uniref:TIGR03668 family PPOX class F420-dependent oxidoreductase n=1 Tax=Pedococcus sp. 5OH_020 TaxID=2989814 RepID=UPI0022E9EF62|nr:TIGR03668 family PPOX class F420-dependent oxidoreductase [Pedococcus sp. 5OH_020]